MGVIKIFNNHVKKISMEFQKKVNSLLDIKPAEKNLPSCKEKTRDPGEPHLSREFFHAITLSLC